MLAIWPEICKPAIDSRKSFENELIVEDEKIDEDEFCHTNFIDKFIFQSIDIRIRNLYRKFE
jgi:hypothetical protein